ncbi:U4/U6 small nuclear ribonucleoprotein PRP4-like protein [Tanacetum coccineum]|uniref:U4/U6 small nuclear ribonucleoprotein PRP4-like protein n=1 Tax=Tanacetum coccineum TaxID=301880 RepID=A0ABQ5FLU4_9ASTR
MLSSVNLGKCHEYYWQKWISFFDCGWRLWGTETGEELLYQQGHSLSVYGLAFHPDASLAASCGLIVLVRVWDLRPGGSILALEENIKEDQEKRLRAARKSIQCTASSLILRLTSRNSPLTPLDSIVSAVSLSYATLIRNRILTQDYPLWPKNGISCIQHSRSGLPLRSH